MANSRDLAEQAFALLQNALSESEARASDLDEQLKRKKAPKTRTEEQLDVLTHRLESVEAERARWEQQAGHLEEIAEAERVKVAQLKKKLEIAESGPEKLTKKEINFWRAKADGIDIETKEYKERLTALRRELNDRDTLVEQLQSEAGTRPPPAIAVQRDTASPADALRAQLAQRDRWLADLRLELHELRGQPTPPLETHAEIETLRSQLHALEQSLSHAASARSAAEADLRRVTSEVAARDRANREAAAANDRDRSTLAQREHRIVELSAEVEHLRNDVRQHDEKQRAESTKRDDRDRELDKQRQLLAANETDFRELRSKLAQRDSELNDHRRQLSDREQAAVDVRRQLDEQGRELLERNRELADRQQQLKEFHQRLVERDQQATAAAADLEQARTTAATSHREVTHLRDVILTTAGELKAVRATLAGNEREVTSLRETLVRSNRELDESRAHKARLETALKNVNAQIGNATSEVAAAREQIAGLETELKEERELAESMGELANERREHMTKLQEQVEEAEERYADANWRLGRSLHFQRIVKRRRGLVTKLLDALRAKMKANTALKAGLDGLRTYKAGAEQNQQKLLQRVDALKIEIRDADEAIKRHQSGTAAKEELINAVARATALEERLNTQAELIQSLEGELKTARLSNKTADNKNHELEHLRKELETRNQVIAKLQADADEQQRRVAKLRGSESETVRLKALTEKDRSEIDVLQQEIAELRQALAQRNNEAPASATAELDAKLKERENSVTRLMGTIKEHEATIKKLNELAESWKRKYQFLAVDSPEAYKSAAEK